MTDVRNLVVKFSQFSLEKNAIIVSFLSEQFEVYFELNVLLLNESEFLVQISNFFVVHTLNFLDLFFSFIQLRLEICQMFFLVEEFFQLALGNFIFAVFVLGVESEIAHFSFDFLPET